VFGKPHFSGLPWINNLSIAEFIYLTPEHFKNTFDTELFQHVPKEAIGLATQQDRTLKHNP